ncbi:MAG: ferredoxin reductase family protein [Actinomycetota bacterium]|nr:ferredoxin reductase family protein [Actinomycetota bacterium]
MLSRPGIPPHPWVVDVAVVVVGIGLGAAVGSTVTTETRSQLSQPGGPEIFLGSLSGMAGTYLALVMLLLVSRVPPVERVLGQDGLLRWHRRLAPWPLGLIGAHAVLLILGYALAAHIGVVHEASAMATSSATMLAATVAVIVMIAIGVASIHQIRRRMRRETWWLLHLFMYLALALAFAHEVVLGPSFVAHPLARILWSVAWVAVAALVAVYRIGMPLVRTLRHRLQVQEVRPEAPGIVSVILSGRHLERLAVSGGQFFEWRFLTRGMWWQAHPFTLSARPSPPYVRLTVKAVGDFTDAVGRLEPGTKVAIEGPYGAFTVHAWRRSRVALLAGGIGVTAVRSLLEDLPLRSQPIVLLRATSAEELVLDDEIAELARVRRGRVERILGPRHQVSMEREIVKHIPHFRTRDFFICGPEGFVNECRRAMASLSVPKDAVHHEVYRL